MTKVDMEEIKKALRDADLYEANLTDEELRSYYTALKDSQSTAVKEDQSRRLNNSQHELFEAIEQEEILNSPLAKSVKHSSSKAEENCFIEVEELNDDFGNSAFETINELDADCSGDATKLSFGFNDIPETRENKLKIITHNMKFLPIQATPRFLRADNRLKAKMIYAYHTKVNKLKAELARQSFIPAPLPKVTNVLSVFPDVPDEGVFEETYVSRSGRQTKRKNYSYDEFDNLEAPSKLKKTKSDEDEEEWLSKSSITKSESKTKTVNKKSVNNNEANEVDLNASGTESTAVVANTESKKFAPKPNLKKLNNSEIMKRSKLFGDLPRRNPSARCDILFEKLIEDGEKKRKADKEMDKFNDSLKERDKENEIVKDAEEEDITVTDEQPTKRRVIPSGRRPINNRSKKTSANNSPKPLNISITKSKSARDSDNSSQEFEELHPIRKKKYVKKTNSDVGISSSQPSTSQNGDSQDCPICGKLFSNDEIQAHASSCGDEQEASKKTSRITCYICDKVVPLNTDYEAHVHECKKSKGVEGY